MKTVYKGVTTRFLRPDERLMTSDESEMPLIIEADTAKDLVFLQQFLETHSQNIKEDIATYGAVLLRGFDIRSDSDFEKTILKIQGFKGIRDAFMSEEGRIHVGDLQYILHTNAVYKTGGTLYLGGFHSENYYSADVPGYICFCCMTPSLRGGETGLINMEKIYEHLRDELKETLETQPFFVSKWLVSEVTKRYQITQDAVITLCKQYDLPVIGEGSEQFILMYKPNVFEHPLTKKKSLQINLFEIPGLNEAMRRCFMKDYHGAAWFWHRLVWRLPSSVLKFLEYAYMITASLCYSPKNAFKNLSAKLNTVRASFKKDKTFDFNNTRVGSCFSKHDVKELAQLIRQYYSSCLWQKGDILLVDNKKVMHAGMPGAGDRLVRAMICNPLAMNYSSMESGSISCEERLEESIGFYMAKQGIPVA